MADRPVEVAYFYRARWGHHDEFVELWTRNHYPLLRAQVESGRLLSVRAFTPRFHGAGEAGWTFLNVITYRDWAAVEEHTDPRIAERLFPDQARYTAQERRRFELLEAHWDVVLSEHPLEGSGAAGGR